MRNQLIAANVLQLCETALNTVYVKPFCITVVSRCKKETLIKTKKMIFKINDKEEIKFYLDISLNKTKSNSIIFYLIPIFKKEKYYNPIFKYTSYDFTLKLFILKFNIHFCKYENGKINN